MNFFHDIPTYIDDELSCVVEIPRGSNAKYEYNVKYGFFELDRCLVTAMNYPANYGFIPRTIAADGDPVDCIIFTDVPLTSGTVVRGTPIAALKMFDKGIEDDKILVVPKFNKRYINYKQIKEEYLEVYKDFFQNYKNLTSRNVEVVGWEDEKYAKNIVESGISKYINSYANII